MAVEVKQLTSISWKGTSVVVPEELVLDNDEGNTFLKLRPSHHVITKLICPDSKKKNLSLSSGTKMNALLSLVHSETLDKKSAENSKQEGAEDLFQQDAPRPKKKQKKAAVEAPSHSVVVTLPNGGSLSVMWPPSKHADVCILLEDSNLERCFEFLESDCSECESTAKRTYSKSGKFSKGALK